MKLHQARCLLFPLALFAGVAGLHAQPTFTGLTMIDPNGSQSSRVSAINATGQVLVDDNEGNLFLWSGGSSTQITNGFGAGPVYASIRGGLNDSGQVTGYVEVGEDKHYFIWSSGSGMTELTTESIEQVRGLNNSGQVVGQAAGEPNYAFTWSSGGGTTALVNPYNNTGYGDAINSSGQVAGTANNSNGDLLAVRWESNGTMTEIAVLGMGGVSAINSSGHVVGDFVDMDTFTDKVFYWDGTTMTTIDVLSENDDGYASAINASGSIVGTSEGDDDMRAFLYVSGATYDLNALAAGYLVENEGDTAGFIRLENAYGINDAGQIIGQGIYYDGIGDTYNAAFFLNSLTAVPEPSTYAAIFGGLALGFVAWRRRRTG